MVTKVQKWGNSLAVRIPKEMIRHLAWKEGSGVVVREDKDGITIRRQEPVERPTAKNNWRRYLIPMDHKKENISGSIDHILYDAPR